MVQLKANIKKLSPAAAHPNVFSFVDYIFQESSVQGLKYIGSPKYRAVERIFWTIAVLACVGYSIYLVEDVISKFYASPIIITFQPEETPVSRIPFPAITICNVNMLKHSVLNELFDEIMENRNHDREAAAKGVYLLEHLAQYCFASPSFQRVVGIDTYDATGRKDFFRYVKEEIMNFNSSIQKFYKSFGHELIHEAWKLYRKASHHCQDMILKCSWSGKEIPCLESFAPIETQNGHCCSFNLMPRYILQNISMAERRAQREEKNLPPKVVDDWKSFSHGDMISMNVKDDNRSYPKYQKAGGRPYGLTVLINPELEDYSTCNTNDARGFTMVAHTPVSLPSIHDYGVAISPGTEAFIDIEAVVTTAKWKDLKDINIDKRGCVFYTDDEAKLEHYNFYANENCNSECVAKHTYKNCTCVVHYMPHNQSQRYCGMRDRDCVKDILYNLTMKTGDSDYCGKCRPACTEFDYKLQVSHFDIRNDFASAAIPFNSTNGTVKNATNYSILHIFFGADTIYVKERKALYNTADLIANAGGLMSLTLGVSIVSIIEFVYYFTIRAYYHYRSTRGREEEGKRRDSNRIRHRQNEEVEDMDYYNWALKHYQLSSKVNVNSCATSILARPRATFPRPIN